MPVEWEPGPLLFNDAIADRREVQHDDARSFLFSSLAMHHARECRYKCREMQRAAMPKYVVFNVLP
jgi:hypothetical protein